MNLPWYPFYPGDYAADTSGLSCEEHGCYFLLLNASWTQGPLQNDLNRLQRLSANPSAETLRYILERYWKLIHQGWINEKLERVRMAQNETHMRKIIGAAKTNFSRYGDEKSRQILIAAEEVRNESSLSDIASDSLATSISGRNQNHNKNQKQTKSKSKSEGKKSRTFVKPTVAEISAYCNERKNNIDPQQFWDFYEAKGWMIGKNKMRVWKRCINTWERNDQSGNETGGEIYGDRGI